MRCDRVETRLRSKGEKIRERFNSIRGNGETFNRLYEKSAGGNERVSFSASRFSIEKRQDVSGMHFPGTIFRYVAVIEALITAFIN